MAATPSDGDEEVGIDVRNASAVEPEVEHNGTVPVWWRIKPQEMFDPTDGGELELANEFEVAVGGEVFPHSHPNHEFDFVMTGTMGIAGDGRVVLCAHDPLTGVDHRDFLVELPADVVLVVEGVFAMRPELDQLWALRIGLDVDPEVSRARGVDRDGNAEVHDERYEPAEDLYVAEVDPAAHADVVIDHTDRATPVILRS
jgi:hypothetical protein